VPTTGAPLSVLQEQYSFLDQNYDDLASQCQTSAQLQILKASYAEARHNLYVARLAIFDSHRRDVQALTSQVEDATRRIEKMTADLKQISEVIDVISSAIALGTKLVGMAGA
jgi:chromosome segregation ATPase